MLTQERFRWPQTSVQNVVHTGRTADVREDYPYLKDEDIEYAKFYTLAHPRVGRPREASAR